MASKVFGTVYVKRNGQPVLVRGDVSLQLGISESEVGKGVDEHTFIKRSPLPGMLKVGRATYDPDTYPLIVSSDPATITVDFANGVSYVANDAQFTGTGEINMDDGSFECEWAADRFDLA